MKILSEKELQKFPLFTLTSMDLESASGGHHTHFSMKRLPTVSVFPLDDADNLYLIDQYRPMYNRIMLEAVAGHMDKKNETPLETGKRELKEEAGISATDWQELPFAYLAGSVILAKSHLFLARGLSIGGAALEDDEEIQIRKIPLPEAVEKVFSGEIDTAASMLGILMIDHLRKEGKL